MARPKNDPELEIATAAANVFIEGITHKAAFKDMTGALLWHSWAVREAFLAGREFARMRTDQTTKKPKST